MQSLLFQAHRTLQSVKRYHRAIVVRHASPADLLGKLRIRVCVDEVSVALRRRHRLSRLLNRSRRLLLLNLLWHEWTHFGTLLIFVSNNTEVLRMHLLLFTRLHGWLQQATRPLHIR